MSKKKGCKNKGQSSHPLYKTWEGMKTRCYNPNKANYHKYGGRGIFVCDEWKDDFFQFISDMGDKPAPHYQLDRENNDEGYNPTNCRWVEPKTNINNRRNSVSVSINNKEYTLGELSEEYHIKLMTINTRYHKGIRGKDLIKPPRKRSTK